MSTVIAATALANGLRNDFDDTYTKIKNRQSDSRLSLVMDMSIDATNRKHEFHYYNSAPHLAFWRPGDSISEAGFDGVQFTAAVHKFGRRIKWKMDDRHDDQTGNLYEVAQNAGKSAALQFEQFFFDLLQGTTNTLPAVPTAPDGASFFSTTDGSGNNRFGASNGNLLTGNGVSTTAAIKSDYYAGLNQYKQFKDRPVNGEPLLTPDTVDKGMLIIHSSADEEAFDEAFKQKRQGQVMGTDAGTTPSNVILDSSRNVQLWGSSRIPTGDWYMFLMDAPKKPTFTLNRMSLQQQTALEGEGNSDSVRDTHIEYIQWWLRRGAGIALPYAALKVNN